MNGENTQSDIYRQIADAVEDIKRFIQAELKMLKEELNLIRK